MNTHPDRPPQASTAALPIPASPQTPWWRRVLLPLAVFATLATMLGWWRMQPGDHSVTLAQARADVEAGRAVLIDLRESFEHATGVAAGAQLLPLRQLAQRAHEIPADPATPVLLICATQNRSQAALQWLHEQGLTHVRYVHGGMSGWVRQGWPTVMPSVSALGAAATGPR